MPWENSVQQPLQEARRNTSYLKNSLQAQQAADDTQEGRSVNSVSDNNSPIKAPEEEKTRPTFSETNIKYISREDFKQQREGLYQELRQIQDEILSAMKDPALDTSKKIWAVSNSLARRRWVIVGQL